LRLLLGGFAAVFAVANFRMWLALPDFFRRITFITHMSITGTRGEYVIQERTFNAYGTIWTDLPHLAVITAGTLLVAMCVFAGPRRSVLLWFMALYALVYPGLIQMAKFGGGPRHQLPALLPVLFLAVAGAFEIARGLRTPRWVPVAVAVALVAAVLPGSSARTEATLRGIRMDSRKLLYDFVSRHVPPDARIAQDWYACLPDPEAKHHEDDPLSLPHDVITGGSVADLGTLDELRAEGIEYVAVAAKQWLKVFRTNVRPRPEAEGKHARRRAFYERLFAEEELVWDSASAGSPPGGFFGLETRLYRITTPASPRP